VQLQQVMMNLIMNSIDAMKEVRGNGRWLSSRMRAEDRHLLVSVSDTGVGLPPQDVSQIFNCILYEPNRTAPVWDCPSAAPSLNRMAAACGPPPNSGRGATFHLTLPTIVEALK